MNVSARSNGDRSGIVDAVCTKCGLDRSADASTTKTVRTPCPRCGETALKYRRHGTAAVAVASHVSTSLRPGQQDRNWRLRWEQLESRLPGITASRSEGRSAAAIHSATQDLFEFFVSAYHLKDALIEDGAVSRAAVEKAINDSNVLTLLADLANLDKHRRLRRQARSGDVPVVESVSDSSEGPRWTLNVLIRHKEGRIDGRAFAGTVLDEWQALLKRWALL